MRPFLPLLTKCGFILRLKPNSTVKYLRGKGLDFDFLFPLWLKVGVWYHLSDIQRQTTGYREGYRMDLNFVFKSIGYGIRRPGFNLALHKSLGTSETWFSPVQTDSALLIYNTPVKLKKKNKRKLQRMAKLRTVLAAK